MSSAADITVLTTGGTIDKVYNLAGELEIGPPAAKRLLEVLRTDLRIDVRSVIAKDSLDITDADRELLTTAVDQSGAAAVVITHGTDTLTGTAEYLRQRATTTNVKSVVLTGALQPAAMTLSDAALNLGAALMASQTLPPGVYVCMSGRVLEAGAARKEQVTGRFLSVSEPKER